MFFDRDFLVVGFAVTVVCRIYCCNSTKCVAEVRVIVWVTVSIKSDLLKGI
jgi:hypothetical protein